jgi:hypothetical protein
MRWRLPAGMAVFGTLAVIIAVLLGTAGSSDGGGTAAITPTAPAVTRTTHTDPLTPPAGGRNAFTARISGAPVGAPIRSGFLGLSFEFQAVRAYTGSDPRQINPVLIQLIRNLSPGTPPVLRIGGDSTDVSYAAGPGVGALPFVGYRLTPSWMATTAALAHALDARMTLGLNLGANRPAVAAAEARDYVRSIGRSSIVALEIGNEPNVYDVVKGYKSPGGTWFHARSRPYGYPQFLREWQAIAATAPDTPLAGPALAVGPTPAPGSWVNTLPDFLTREQQVQTMTVHRYPLRNCYVPPSSPQYPTVSHLLAGYATAGLANSLRRWIAIAHAQHRQIRVDELNSVACRGKAGVSDTFASSLWVLDALFELARAGVDGVNVHTLPDSAYELFAFRHAGGRWSAAVRPVYYGLQMFAEAVPPGARLLAVRGVASGTRISVWAARAPDRRVSVVVVNEDPSRSRTVTVTPPPGVTGAPTLERLRASSVHAKRNITLGGRTYGPDTGTGTLPPAVTEELGATRSGAYRIAMPRGSAALLTFAP